MTTRSPRVIPVDGDRLTVITCTPAPAAHAALATCKRSLVMVGPETPAEILATAEAFGWHHQGTDWRCNLHGSIKPARQ